MMQGDTVPRVGDTSTYVELQDVAPPPRRAPSSPPVVLKADDAAATAAYGPPTTTSPKLFPPAMAPQQSAVVAVVPPPPTPGGAPAADVYNDYPEQVFLGDIAWSYVKGFLSWVMRNPKTFSSMLVTMMLILFTKYAQDIVVEVVQYVVKAHPNLIPTDDLRSKTAVLGNELRSYINVAMTTGASYMGRNVSCSNLSSIMTTEFLSVPFALQTSFGVSLYFSYISYLMPDGVHWGDCGCQGLSQSSADSALCSYTDNNGVLHAFHGINTSREVANPIPNSFTEQTDYTMTIRGLTVADQQAGGVWQTVTRYDDPFLNQSFTVLTYSYPLAFDPVTGKCIAAASVDIATNLLSPFLMTRMPNTEVILVGYGRGRPDLMFLTDNYQGALGPTIYTATQTPKPRINSMVKVMNSLLDQDGNPIGVLQNTSMVLNGMLYESLTVLDNFSAIAMGPTALATYEIGDALLSLLSEFERSAQALKASALISTSTCRSAADAKQSSMFLRELSNLLKSFGVQVYGAFLAYPTIGNTLGACGCEQLSSATTGSNATYQSCFYVDSNLNMLRFSDPKFPANDMQTLSFADTQRSVFIQTVIPTLTNQNKTGVWTKPAPYSYSDSRYSVSAQLITYIIPISFDSVTGLCNSAMVMDISLTFVPSFLTKFTRGGLSDLHLFDISSQLYMGSSSSWYTTDVYNILATPNATINKMFQAIYNEVGPGLMFDMSVNTPDGQGIINFGHVDGTRWGVVEVLPVEAAVQKFYPIPSITSSSQALSLLPMDINMQLFFIVLAIIFLFTLNMFILGCSTVGETAAPPPPPAAAPSMVVQSQPSVLVVPIPMATTMGATPVTPA